jgi:hypothetical protein
MDSSHSAEEIRAAVQELVGRFGVGGTLVLDGAVLVLQGAGPAVSVDFTGLLEQWSELPADHRQRRCLALARELSQSRRTVVSQSQPQGTGFGLDAIVKPLAALGLVVLLTSVFLLWNRQEQPQTKVDRDAGPSAASLYEVQRVARTRAACEKTRARIQQGATPTVLDVDGWVVEILLLRQAQGPRLISDPGLGPFLRLDPGGRTGRFAWPAAPELLEADGPGTIVTLEDASLRDPGGAEGLTLTFAGRYVAPYFAESQRPVYTRVAASLAERLGATHAALYARCEHEHGHQLGSWFRGGSPAEAATALVYAMGAWSDPPQVEVVDAGAGRPIAESLARVEVFSRIQGAALRLKRPEVAKLVGHAGGMIAGPQQGPSTLTFPFKDGNRSSRASRRLAFELSLTNVR